MKKKKLKGKLGLNKMVVSKLNPDEASEVVGGMTFFCTTTLATQTCETQVTCALHCQTYNNCDYTWV